MFYIIFSGCEIGQELNKAQLKSFLKENKLRLGFSFEKNWLLINSYNEFVGDCYKFEG